MATPSRREALYRTVALIFERRWLIATVFGLGVVLTLFGTWLIPPTWDATTRILVHPNPRQQMILFEEIQAPGLASKDVVPANNLIEISRSRWLAELMVQQFGLDEEMRRHWEEPERLRDKMWVGVVTVATLPLRIVSGWIGPDEATDWTAEAVDRFLDEEIDVRLVADTEIVHLTVTAGSPQRAVEMANTLAEMLVQRTRDLDREQARSAYDLTSRSLADAQERLRRSETALDDYRRSHGVVDPGRQQELQLQRLDALEDDLARERVERDRLHTQLDEIERRLALQEERIVSGSERSANPVLIELRKQLHQLELDHARLGGELTAEHPDMVSLEAQILEARERIGAEAEMILSGETTRLSPFYEQLMKEYLEILPRFAAATARLAGLAAETRSLRGELEGLSRKTPGYAELQRLYLQDLELYNSLTSRLAELEVQSVSGLSEFDIKIFDRAALSDLERPTRPSWLLNLAAGIVLSLFAGIALALFLDYWRDTFRTPREIEVELGIPVLGTVPTAPGLGPD